MTVPVVEVWVVPLDVPDAVRARLHTLLDADERARAARFRFRRLADRWTVAHGRLRQVLGRTVGADPAGLRFTTGTYGRPALPGGPSFSLSHAGALALVAVAPADGPPVGVDVEPAGESAVADDLLPTVCTAGERALLDGLAPSARLGALLRLWTRKEACLKGRGTGLSVDPAHVDALGAVPPEPYDGVGAPVRVRLPPDATSGDADGWWVRDLVPAPGSVGAVALPRRTWEVRRRLVPAGSPALATPLPA